MVGVVEEKKKFGGERIRIVRTVLIYSEELTSGDDSPVY